MPTPTDYAALIEAVVKLYGTGKSGRQVAAALRISPNSVAGIIYRHRKAHPDDPRTAERGSPLGQSKTAPEMVERDALIVTLAKQGKSRQQIAQEATARLGRGVTYATVKSTLSIAKKRGIYEGGSPSQPGRAPQPVACPAPSPAPPPSAPIAAPPPTPPAKPVAAPVAMRRTEPVEGCRWPMADPFTAEFRYCDAPREGSSHVYCAYHASIAYVRRAA